MLKCYITPKISRKVKRNFQKHSFLNIVQHSVTRKDGRGKFKTLGCHTKILKVKNNFLKNSFINILRQYDRVQKGGFFFFKKIFFYKYFVEQCDNGRESGS